MSNALMPPATQHAYLFEAKGIQKWILDGGRLRDIAAASHILAMACRSDQRDLLRTVMGAAGFTARTSRRAGGAFMLHFPAQDVAAFNRFRALWHLIFCQVAPGLEYVESSGVGGTDAEARANAYDAQRQTRLQAGRDNTVASLLPLGHPLVCFALRTGRPAVASERDRTTLAKRRQDGAGDAVGEKFQPTGTHAWPNQMDDLEPDQTGGTEFPFVADNRWIAVMHADISGLGQFYADVGAAARTATDPIEVARQASNAIETTMIEAARTATHAILQPIAEQCRVMPARPIVLGGDDITIILRGDVALPFARIFLEELEKISITQLGAFSKAYLPPNEAVRGPLTAAAGLAFGKAKQPFFRLLAMAEDLCGHAKAETKQAAAGGQPASAVSFLRITESALASDATEMFDRLSVSGDRRLSAQPYRVGNVTAQGFADLGDLEALRETLTPALRAGRLREIRSLLLQGMDAMAEEDWQRWQGLARRRDKDGFQRFEDALASMLRVPPTNQMPLFAGADLRGPLRNGTPLFDAMECNAIHRDEDAEDAP